MDKLLVKTGNGIIRGVRKIGHLVFRGIPYAKAPVGELRWKRPEPPLKWDGIREARFFANRPFEPGYPLGTSFGKEFGIDEDYIPPMSEDCLYLNIWAPAETVKVKDADDIKFPAGEKLPVAFWIHGGGFFNGYASEPEYDGAAFAKRGVILVTVGYRLGVLGFLVHPWLSEEGGGISGNYGLYDQVAALDWVRENISLFGGDPDNITIFGQSAGAVSVQALVSSKLTRGKIKGAILQSGGGYNPSLIWFRPRDAAEEIGRQFVNFCQVKSLEEFRALPGEKILEFQTAFLAHWKVEHPGDRLPIRPCVDNLFLDDIDYKILEQGAHHNIPYMIGCTAVDAGVTPEQAKAGERSYLYKAAAGFCSLNEKPGRSPAWMYIFSQEPQGDNAGAHHSSELYYLFGTLDRNWRPRTPGDYALSERIISYWTNFFETGNPNGNDVPDWRPYTDKDSYIMELRC